MSNWPLEKLHLTPHLSPNNAVFLPLTDLRCYQPFFCFDKPVNTKQNHGFAFFTWPWSLESQSSISSIYHPSVFVGLWILPSHILAHDSICSHPRPALGAAAAQSDQAPVWGPEAVFRCGKYCIEPTGCIRKSKQDGCQDHPGGLENWTGLGLNLGAFTYLAGWWWAS